MEAPDRVRGSLQCCLPEGRSTVSWLPQNPEDKAYRAEKTHNMLRPILLTRATPKGQNRLEPLYHVASRRTPS
jgi:hypothetical protein